MESALFFLDNALFPVPLPGRTRAFRRAEDRFLNLLGMYPFECRGCDLRFYVGGCVRTDPSRP